MESKHMPHIKRDRHTHHSCPFIQPISALLHYKTLFSSQFRFVNIQEKEGGPMNAIFNLTACEMRSLS